MFTVQVWDLLVFQPCGDSAGTNLIYTNGKEVFDECIPQMNVSSDVRYVYIGDCVNNSWSGRLMLYMNQVRTFYLLSNHEHECENGLKAMIIVVEMTPSPPSEPTNGIPTNEDQPATGGKGNGTETTALPSVPTADGVVYIPWNSESLKNNNVFIVQVGDLLVFKPCGDSEGTNLIYTNAEEVFEECTPQKNVSSEIRYVYIGTCVNNSWGELKLHMNEARTLYLLSDYESECENGLKAMIVVEGTTTPPPGEPTDGLLDNELEEPTDNEGEETTTPPPGD